MDLEKIKQFRSAMKHVKATIAPALKSEAESHRHEHAEIVAHADKEMGFVTINKHGRYK